jgi:hypothetical protein
MLRELFYFGNARYKIWYKEEFLVFSPETFIQIKNQKIVSFPMKGTIDATMPGAKEKILADQKELAEHVTIVDLLRNDLSSVASSVKVRDTRRFGPRLFITFGRYPVFTFTGWFSKWGSQSKNMSDYTRSRGRK